MCVHECLILLSLELLTGLHDVHFQYPARNSPCKDRFPRYDIQEASDNVSNFYFLSTRVSQQWMVMVEGNNKGPGESGTTTTATKPIPIAGKLASRLAPGPLRLVHVLRACLVTQIADFRCNATCHSVYACI